MKEQEIRKIADRYEAELYREFSTHSLTAAEMVLAVKLWHTVLDHVFRTTVAQGKSLKVAGDFLDQQHGELIRLVAWAIKEARTTRATTSTGEN